MCVYDYSPNEMRREAEVLSFNKFYRAADMLIQAAQIVEQNDKQIHHSPNQLLVQEID